MSKYIDAHCHTGQTSTVDAIVNAATILDWGRVVELSKAGMYGAVGVHPWYLNDLPNNWYAILREMLIQNPELHVGEIGLDKHKPDMDLQISVFEQQLLLAHEFGRGITMHCVGTWEYVTRILRMFQNKLPCFILAHGYNGPVHMIQKFADEYNMYFSYGPRNIKNPSRILATPHDRILAETDSDNPSGVIDVINQIANILYIDPDKMADIIYNNTIRMLKHGQIA